MHKTKTGSRSEPVDLTPSRSKPQLLPRHLRDRQILLLALLHLLAEQFLPKLIVIFTIRVASQTCRVYLLEHLRTDLPPKHLVECV